ncbi:MAG: 1-acyl-sn-glycerol-3-phosphate acyltransferase [Jatrophihabitans sp.]|nr:MAG: 1-acyl-sn-glycerol-3-phosphate acyltransferase [Jatrophihabitans sp.]
MSRLHRPRAGFWIRLCVVVIYPFVGLIFRVRFRDLDRVTPPAEGGVIIALNHVSHIDTLLMARMVWQSGRVPRFMVKSTLFARPGVGAIMRGAAQIPVYRGTADAAGSLRDAVRALRRGEAVVVYPEGTITQDPRQWPMQARTGIARLALLAPEIPVIPIGQWGAQRTRPRWRRYVTRPVARVSVGKPVDLDRFRGAEANAATLRDMTDTIMSAVRDEVAALRGAQSPTEFFTPTRTYVDGR